MRNSLEAAVLKASAAQVDAYGKTDVGPLAGAVIGEAHKKMVNDIDELRHRGMYIVHELENQRFDSFAVDPTRQHAKVLLTETWTTKWYSAQTHECEAATESHQVPQWVSLEKHADGWIVSDYTTYGKTPAPTACR